MPPTLLLESGVTFRTMRDRYGLTPDLMVFLKYSVDEWITLGIDEGFLQNEVGDDKWQRIFGNATREELLTQIRRRNHQLGLSAVEPTNHTHTTITTNTNTNYNNNNNNNNNKNNNGNCSLSTL